MWAKSKHTSGFTIVELLIVIVVIGILAAISIVAYSGIQQKAIAASLQSDLANGSNMIKLFQVDNTAYPANIADCPIPAASNLCLKSSPGTVYQYAANNGTQPQSFSLAATKGTQSYIINQDGILLPGGKNLFQKSATFINYTSGTDQANPVATYTADATNGDYQTFVVANGGNRYWYPLMAEDRIQGQTYTISLEVKTTVATWGGYWYPSEIYNAFYFPNTNGSWQRWSWTYTQTGATSNGNKLFGFHCSTVGASISFRKLKLETGSVATGWVTEP